MKRSVSCLVGLICLLVFVTSVASKSKKETPPPPPDWNLVDVNAWDEQFYKLVPAPTEDGNAATYFLNAIHNEFFGKKDGKKAEFYPWLSNFGKDTWKSDKPEDKELTQKAIGIPELELMVKGSKQKNYQIYGIHLMPSPKADIIIYEEPLPKYINHMRLAYALMARANHKIAQRDPAGAEEDMFAVLRIGHILQRDVFLIGHMVGIAIETIAAKEMPDFYKKLGNEEKAKAWEDFSIKAEKHRSNNKRYIRYVQSLTLEEMTKIVKNPNLPRSFRIEAIMMVIGNHFMEKPISTRLFGLPEEIREFVIQEYFDDPEMIIIQFKIIEDVYAGLLSNVSGRKKMR